jgi:hypothetical protein
MGIRTTVGSGLVAARHGIGERVGRRHTTAGPALGVFTALVAVGCSVFVIVQRSAR